MTAPNPFAAQLLRASTEGLSGIAASRLLEADPTLQERHAPQAFDVWRNHMRVQLGALGAALADGVPAGFARQAAWARSAFETRDVPVADLEHGLRTLRAVLEEELPPQAAGAVADFFDAANEALTSLGEPEKELAADSDPNRLGLRYLEALLRGEGRRAWSLIDEALADGMTPETVLLEVLPAVQREVGRLWHRNELSVGEEHFVTQTTRRAAGRLVDRAEHEEANGKCVVIAGVAGDSHDLPAQLVADAFELDGWRVVCLGGDIPPSELALAAIRFDADLVALSATLDVQREAAAESIAALRTLPSPPPVLVGGAAFAVDERLWQRSGADGHARDASGAVREGRRLAGL